MKTMVYFEWIVAMNDCCVMVHFDCTLWSNVMIIPMYLLVYGRQNSNRFATMQMNYCMNCLCCCHCMVSVE